MPNEAEPALVTLDDVRAAAERLRGVAVRTPLVGFGPPADRRFLKAESLQPVGAFKLRGAYAAIATLPPEALARGVPTKATATRDSGRGTGGARPPAGTDDPDRPTRPSRQALPVQHPPLPDPIPLCCAMVQAAVEALRGARPLAQLARWVSPEIYDQLAVRSELTQRVLGQRDTSHRAAIRRIRLCRLGDDAAEASVIVEDGPRVRAVAVRLEAHRGQWRATAMEIG